MTATMSPLPSSINVPTSQPSSACRRCGGMLVNEQCIDLAGSEGGARFCATRCVQCGDLIDPVILRNRHKPPQVEELIEEIEETIEQAA